MPKFLGRFLSGSGAVLAMLFFFLPWVLVSCSGNSLGSVSGWELAAGMDIGGQHVDGSPALFLLLLLALAALVVAVAVRRPVVFAVVEVVIGVSAMLLMLLVYVQMRHDLLNETMGIIQTSPRAGLIGSLLGYMLISGGGIIAGGGYAFSQGWLNFLGLESVGGEGSRAAPSAALPRRSKPKPVPRRAASPPPSAQPGAAHPHASAADEDVTALDGVVPAVDGVFQPKAALIVQNGPWRNRQLLVEGDDVLLGRGSQCQICFPDKFVSRRHARLRYAQGQWFIQDQNSSGGTFVNGERVNAIRLNDGDVIRIGKTELRFRTT